MNIRDHLPLVEPPDSVWDAIEARLQDIAMPRPRWPIALATAALVLLTAAAAFWVKTGRTGWIEATVRTTLPIGDIGSVDLEPNTRLRVLIDRADQHRLRLAHGTIHAKITAPPRLFFVETKSGTAIDLGCEYDLHVDEQGSGTLRVTKGWVSFQRQELESVVPAGALCRIRAGTGPGLPYFEDASPEFARAADSESIDSILTSARLRDTLTLWHLLLRVPVADRARIYDRMTALTPLPPSISRQGVLALDPQTMNVLRDELAWKW
jgi:hypothetical protein